MSKDPASMGVEVNKPKPPFRPDLTQSKTPDLNAERILSALGSPGGRSDINTRGSKKSPSVFMVVILLALAVAGTAYWYLTTQINRLPRSVNVAKADMATLATDSQAAASLPVTPKAPDPQKPDSAGQAQAQGQTPATQTAVAAVEPAAQIINEPRAPTDTAKNAESKLTDALEKDVKPPKAALQKALDNKTSSAKTNSNSNTNNNTKANPKTNAGPIAKPATKPADATQTASNVTSAASDKDINLIAALLAHNSATQSNVRSTPVKAGSTDTQAKSAGTPPAVNQPTVTARLNSGGSALKQCEGLDLLQFEVCKFKVCDKLWETDASCKASLSPAR